MSNKITKKDVVKSWVRYFLAAEVGNNYERLTALAFGFGIAPILDKLYGDNPKELAKAYQRHISFYNSEANWGSLINGITIALEEERAAELEKTGDMEQADQTAEMITNIKVGLMGPLAGIGDSINQGTIRPIVIAMFIPLALAGNFIGGIGALVVFGLLMSGLAYFCVMQGYSRGRESISSVLQSGAVRKLIDTAGVLGLFMMGALSASYVKLKTIFVVATQGGKFAIQDTLDKMIPNLLSLLAVFLIYFYVKKRGPKYIRIVLAIIVISLVLSFLGIV